MKKKQIIAGIVLVIFCGLIVICVIKNRKSAVQNVDNQNTSEGQIVETMENWSMKKMVHRY